MGFARSLALESCTCAFGQQSLLNWQTYYGAHAFPRAVCDLARSTQFLLHPGNLIIFKNGQIGFIDLGMVGHFDTEMRRRMLYYFYALVMGNPANAARYLSSLALVDRHKAVMSCNSGSPFTSPQPASWPAPKRV